ncbi:MAG: hypothetical protein CL663_06935 [Bacteroidetes bacterium]|nr:hypothetical protein [Bacteroidota bacterium]|tara:strand:+ start:368 stop:862 length:495 start_codon:yes stop_codon:yes gene_type:complete
MKKALLTVFLSFIMITAFSQIHVGFGGAFGTKGGKDASGDKSAFGLHMRLLTEVDDTFGIIAGYNYFPQQKYDQAGYEAVRNFSILHLNGQVFLANEADFQFYGIGGFNYHLISEKFRGATNKGNAFSYEAGLGVKLDDDWNFYVETKYVGHSEQIIVVLGIFF